MAHKKRERCADQDPLHLNFWLSLEGSGYEKKLLETDNPNICLNLTISVFIFTNVLFLFTNITDKLCSVIIFQTQYIMMIGKGWRAPLVEDKFSN